MAYRIQIAWKYLTSNQQKQLCGIIIGIDMLHKQN